MSEKGFIKRFVITKYTTPDYGMVKCPVCDKLIFVKIKDTSVVHAENPCYHFAWLEPTTIDNYVAVFRKD